MKQNQIFVTFKFNILFTPLTDTNQVILNYDDLINYETISDECLIMITKKIKNVISQEFSIKVELLS